MMHKKIAAFISGAAIVEIINHMALMTNNILPMHFWGFIISEQMNLIVLVGWIIIFLCSFYYAWLKKD